MNKQIKFRVWSNKQNKFIINECNKSTLFNIWDWTIQMSTCLTYPIEDYIFQQYVGLQDKNGKEIYEGDILKCKGYNNWFDTEGYCYNMEVKDIIVSSRESEASGFIYIPINREIIGNVFENSELLTK